MIATIAAAIAILSALVALRFAFSAAVACRSDALGSQHGALHVRNVAGVGTEVELAAVAFQMLRAGSKPAFLIPRPARSALPPKTEVRRPMSEVAVAVI